MEAQRRTFATIDPKFAVNAAEGKPVTLTGYACIWGELSSDRGGYKVRLAKDSATIAKPAHALFHHDYRLLIGSTENNSLRFTSDDVGLKVEIDLPNTQAGRDVAELIKGGYCRGMSFAMVGEPRFVTTTENGDYIKDVEAFALDEVTITPIPAFQQTNIGIKSNSSGEGFSKSLNAEGQRWEKLKLEMMRL